MFRYAARVAEREQVVAAAYAAIARDGTAITSYVWAEGVGLAPQAVAYAMRTAARRISEAN